MIKTLTILLFALPVSADSIITKSVCDEMYEVILEEPEYVNKQAAIEIYERCIASIYQ